MSDEKELESNTEPHADEELPSRSRSTSGRPDYKVDTEEFDLKEEDDDDEYRENEDIDADADDNFDAADADEDFETKPSRSLKHSRTDDENKSETEDFRGGSALPGTPSDIKKPHYSVPVDDMGAPLPVINEEYDLPDDEEGETKITKNGELLGGRQFLVRSFTLLDKGRRRFMLSTEPARAVGFRDSYLFFQYHPNLYKYIISQEQKNDLIDRSVLPYSYRNRQIALVTARSVFKEFGAKIIVNGKNITDDYYAIKLREEGHVIEGTYAREPPKKVLRAADSLDYAVGAINPAKNAVEFFDKRHQTHNTAAAAAASTNKVTATNWLYQHAAACSRFNSDLFYDRARILLIEQQGIRDPYTNTLHFPLSTQSTSVLDARKLPIKRESKNNDDDYQIKYETLIADADLTRTGTGLSEIPSEIYEDVVNDEVKEAIREQQKFEKTLL